MPYKTFQYQYNLISEKDNSYPIRYIVFFILPIYVGYQLGWVDFWLIIKGKQRSVVLVHIVKVWKIAKKFIGLIDLHRWGHNFFSKGKKVLTIWPLLESNDAIFYVDFIKVNLLSEQNAPEKSYSMTKIFVFT
jgi:hypothetical protein